MPFIEEGRLIGYSESAAFRFFIATERRTCLTASWIMKECKAQYLSAIHFGPRLPVNIIPALKGYQRAKYFSRSPAQWLSKDIECAGRFFIVKKTRVNAGLKAAVPHSCQIDGAALFVDCFATLLIKTPCLDCWRALRSDEWHSIED